MIMDTRLLFASALALNTGVPATYVMGDNIDLLSARDVGNGDPMWFVAYIAAAATGAGASLNLQLISDTAANMTTAPTVLLDSGVIAVAALTAGAVIIRAAIPIMKPARRFLGIKQVTSGAAFTGGTFTCGLVDDPNAWAAQIALSQA